MDGLYGTTRPAVIDPKKDVEIFYSYKPDRSAMSVEDERFIKLENDGILMDTATYKDGSSILNLPGMYNLRLPIKKFGRKGIYTIYIKPKEYTVDIVDVSVLLTFPDVRGIVFKKKDFNDITDLTGYRIDLVNEKNNTITRTGESRIITSSNPAVPRKTSTDDKYAEDIRYSLSDSSSDLLFCTVTPSIAQSFRPNALPYIGAPGKKVIVACTKFNPETIELEMVDHDADTISYMLEGSQVRDLDKGKIVTFNDKKDIYAYHDYFTLKSKLGEPLYDVKVKKDAYDAGGDDYKSIIEQ